VALSRDYADGTGEEQRTVQLLAAQRDIRVDSHRADYGKEGSHAREQQQRHSGEAETQRVMSTDAVQDPGVPMRNQKQPVSKEPAQSQRNSNANSRTEYDQAKSLPRDHFQNVKRLRSDCDSDADIVRLLNHRKSKGSEQRYDGQQQAQAGED
jgi:hypothetical protein